MRMLIVVICANFALMGCSFSKKNNESTSIKKVQIQSQADNLTEGQKNLIAAVKLGEISLVKKVMQELKPSELDFSGTSTTPLGTGLLTGDLEILKYLLESKLNPFDLGMAQENYSEMVFLAMMRHALPSFKSTDDNAEFTGRELTDAGELIYDKQFELLDSVFKEFFSGNQQRAKSMLNQLKVGDQFFEEQAIFKCRSILFEQSDNSGWDCVDLLKYLNSIKPTVGNPNRIQALYQLALMDQYRDQFRSVNLLVYLNKHPKLISTMWNIDKSGIWVSPKLLRSMALKDQQVIDHLKHCEHYEECRTMMSLRHDGVLSKFEDLRSDEFYLIHITGNKIQSSFRNDSFLDGILIDRMEVFLKESSLIYSIEDGIVDISESKEPWSVGNAEKKTARFPKDDTDTCEGFCELPTL